jgi:polyisoprenyl-teichoic acid--peptidoglycan teichoic acid transferase
MLSRNRQFIHLVDIAYRFRYLLLALLIAIPLIFAGRYASSVLRQTQITPQDLLGFFGQSDSTLEQTNGMTNFLILGVRGQGHTDSPNISDTIMLVSYHHNSRQLTTLSLPRDLYLPEFQTKINSIYHYGVVASPEASLRYTQSALLTSLGVPIHYTTVVSFDLFRSVIDYLGGLTVDVEVGFTDPLYPLPGKENAEPKADRYETIVFEPGAQLMDGDTALKYVRSRMSGDDQGTDFSRNRRQQEIISSLKRQVLSPDFFLNQDRVNGLIDTIYSQVTTNVTPDLYPVLARLLYDTRNQPIRSIVLSDQKDDSGVSILYNPPLREYKGEWVLVAKDKNYKALRQYLSDLLSPQSD